MTTQNFVKWCDRESVNAGKACVVAMTLLDLLLRKLMEAGEEDNINKIDVEKTVSAGLSYCRSTKEGIAVKQYLHGVQQQIADIVPPGCAPIDNQTSAYLRNHITKNVLLLYARDAIWKHVDGCLRAFFNDSKVRDRDTVLRHIQCNAPYKAGTQTEMMAWLDKAGIVSDLKEIYKYEKCTVAEDEGDEEEEGGTAPVGKKQRKPRGEELLKGNKMINYLVVLSSRVRFRILNSIKETVTHSGHSMDEEGREAPLLRRWKRFSLVPVMVTSRAFVTIDKLTIRSFLEACAKETKLDIKRSSPGESKAKKNAQDERRTQKEENERNKASERVRQANRKQWVSQQLKTQQQGRKRQRDEKKTKKQLEDEYDIIHPPVLWERCMRGRGSGEWVAPDFFSDICLAGVMSRSQWESFLESVELCHILRIHKREEKGGARCMATFKTNGIEAHVPFEVRRTKFIQWEEGKGSPPTEMKKKGHSGDFPSKDSSTFATLPCGAWKAEALTKNDFEAAKVEVLHFVDPGVKNIFTSSSCDVRRWFEAEGRFMTSTSMKTSGWTKGQYYNSNGASMHRFRGIRSETKVIRSGRKRIRVNAMNGDKIQRGWMPPDVTKSMTELPTMKVFTYKEACEAAQKRLQVMLYGNYWKFMSCRKLARNRFRRHKRSQRALDKMVNKIAPQQPPSAVVFGNFSGRRALKGEAGVAPVKKLRRHLALTRRLIILDEYKTTKMCSFCDNELSHPKEARMIRDRKVNELLFRKKEKTEMTEVEQKVFRFKAKSVVREVNGVCICSNHGRLARDPNASHNMSQCFWSLLFTGARPERLQRPKPCTSTTKDMCAPLCTTS